MDKNRIIWILVFLAGTAVFSWLEWRNEQTTWMGWFMLTSIWSAACGIGYSLADWLIRK